MAYLILIKHALPAIDPARAAPEWSLSQEGRRRCASLAMRLAPYRIERLFTSDEPKAIETGALIGERLGLAAPIAPGLHEHERWTAPFHDSIEAFQAAVAQVFSQPQRLVLGEETADAAYARFAAAVATILGAYPGQNLALVSHGTVISLFVARLQGLDPYPLWHRLGLPSFVVLTHPALALVEIVERV